MTNSLIQAFVLNHFSAAQVVTSSYTATKNQNEFAEQTETIINHLLDPAGDETTYDKRETATALYLIDVVEGYTAKRDKPAAKAARDCLRKRLNAHLKEHGLSISFKLKTSAKPTRIEFAPVKTQDEEKAEREAKKLENTPPTTQSSALQLEKIQDEKTIEDQVKILVKLAKDLPADSLEDLILNLQLIQVEREDQAKINLKNQAA